MDKIFHYVLGAKRVTGAPKLHQAPGSQMYTLITGHKVNNLTKKTEKLTAGAGAGSKL